MLATQRTAESYQPASDSPTPGQVLAAFKAAAPHLGFAPRIVHAVDWLFRFTQPQDWQPGCRPIVWPSASMVREGLGLGPTQAKSITRYLVEQGLVAMQDSPNGKRWGRRDPSGRIIEAYGFDLSPLATRLAEFQAAAEAGRQERERMRHLRRRVTIARRGIAQILETVAELGLSDATWQRLAVETKAIVTSLARVERSQELELGTFSLERRQREARERLESALASRTDHANEGVETDPMGPENRPLTTTTNHPLNLNRDTVMAFRECKSVGQGLSDTPRAAPGGAGAREGEGRASTYPHNETPRSGQNSGPTARSREDAGPVLKVNVDELLRLAPRLRPYLASPRPNWPDIIEAADWLRHDLGVSRPLWGDACLAMGREQAAIALAIVSAKPEGHFKTGPGGYFNAMVARAKRGELNLARTIWGLRARQPGQRERH